MELIRYIPKDWQIRPHTKGVRLIAPDSEVAQDFVQGTLKHLEQTANRLRGVIEVAWDGCNCPYEIRPRCISSDSSNPSLKPLLIGGDNDANVNQDISVIRQMQLADAQLMERILTSRDPMAMVGLTDHVQVLINQPMAIRLGTTCKAARGRNLRPLHNHGWLPELLKELQQQGQARVKYQAWLNAQDEVYGELTTLFEVGIFQGEPVRIATNLDLNIIESPKVNVIKV